jgi:serine protease AprX
MEMSNKNNPIQSVKVTQKDFKDVPSPKPNSKPIREVTKELVDKLKADIEQSAIELRNHFNTAPNVPAVLKIRLLENALAKSHRPDKVFKDTTCPIIGTADFGVLLVSANEDGISQLKTRIQSTAKSIQPDIAVIEEISVFSSDDRLHVNSFEVSNFNAKKYKVHLFDHLKERQNERIKEYFNNSTAQMTLDVSFKEYSSHTSFHTVKVQNQLSIQSLAKNIAVRSIEEMPTYSPSDFKIATSPVGPLDSSMLPDPLHGFDYPVVAVVDSGICRTSKQINKWVISRKSFVPEEVVNTSHGTMVGGLIASPSSLNYHEEGFPNTQAKLVDITVFDTSGNASEDDLMEMISEAVEQFQNIKIWNLSIGRNEPTKLNSFSDFGCFLDDLSEKYGILFVVASGNHNTFTTNRSDEDKTRESRVSSPGDSLRALTVGSIAHKKNPQSASKEGQCSPFSRIGPGPAFTPKPEVIHFGGNCTGNGGYAQIGVLSCGPEDQIYESVGTSFSTPIVSSIAANAWQSIEKTIRATPEKVKALVIHSAVLDCNGYEYATGFGKPRDIDSLLYCSENQITLMFEVDVRHGLVEFDRSPIPLPSSVQDKGKFKGEVAMTLVYSPPLDQSFGSEYSRVNISVSMGETKTILDEATGELKTSFSGKVPPLPSNKKDLYEINQLKNSFKWSPTKAHKKKYPQGTSVQAWKLKMESTIRAEEKVPITPQKAVLLVTVKSINEGTDLYNDTVRLLKTNGWILNPITITVPVTVTINA